MRGARSGWILSTMYSSPPLGWKDGSYYRRKTIHKCFRPVGERNEWPEETAAHAFKESESAQSWSIFFFDELLGNWNSWSHWNVTFLQNFAAQTSHNHMTRILPSSQGRPRHEADAFKLINRKGPTRATWISLWIRVPNHKRNFLQINDESQKKWCQGKAHLLMNLTVNVELLLEHAGYLYFTARSCPLHHFY